jgi:hypothetical protein
MSDTEPQTSDRAGYVDAQIDQTRQTAFRAVVALLSHLNEPQTRDYRHRIAIAKSLVNAYHSSLSERNAAERNLKQHSEAAIRRMLYAVLTALGCYFFISFLELFETTSVSIIVFAFATWVVSFIFFVNAHEESLRSAATLHEKFREHYLQQWLGLELNWELLSRFAAWRAREALDATFTLEQLQAGDQYRHEIDKHRLEWELQTALISVVLAGHYYSVMPELRDAGDWPEWETIATDSTKNESDAKI